MQASVQSCLQLRNTITLQDELLCGAYNLDGSFLALGCGNGAIRVHRGSTGEEAYVLAIDDSLPVTCLRYLPDVDGDHKNRMVAVYASGMVRRWHVTSQTCQSEHKLDTAGALTTVAVSQSGKQFLTGGTDFIVRVFDSAVHRVTRQLGPGAIHGSDASVPQGHTNRVFALAYHPTDENIAVSGGWDKTVQIWDLRQSRPARYLTGPYISGSALSFSPDGKNLLTGSYREHDSLQVWDFASGKVRKTFFNEPNQSCWVFSCQYGAKTPDLVFSVGVKNNSVRMLDGSTGKVQGQFDHEHGFFDCGVHPSEDSMFALSSKHELMLFDIKKEA
eukprot:m.78582 g.78582  ORF g.78582 m.78582 type:complete len:331 (+) comp17366_c0_seq3:48-1040(+)